jgi:hypothetical protein
MPDKFSYASKAANVQYEPLLVRLPPEKTTETPKLTSPRVSQTLPPRVDKDGFQLPREQYRKLRKQQGIIGSRKNRQTNLKSGTEHTDLFVYRVHNDQSDEDVTSFLTDENVHIVSISKVSHQESKMKSFKVRIKSSDLDKVMSDVFWPDGIGCRKFFTSRFNESANNTTDKNG